MERNRNLDFDEDVEVDSLKDAVWRLTTRVYLLEDFIAEKFGEVLTPSGFSKSTADVPRSSASQSSPKKVNSTTGTSNIGKESGRKRRKRRHATHTEAEGESNKIQRQLVKTDKVEVEPLSITNIQSLDSERSLTDLPLVPKNEVELKDDDDSDGNCDFFNDKSEDDDDDPNDSTEKDPDFNPSLETDNCDDKLQNPQPKKRERSKHGPIEEKVGNDSGNDVNEITELANLSGVTLMKSQRGGDKIGRDGYVYSKTNEKGVVTYWRCEKYPVCPSRAIHSPKGGLEVTKEHNHNPDPSRVDVIQLREKVRKLAGVDSETPSPALFQKALEGVPPDIASILNGEVWKRNIRYIRKRASTNTTAPTTSNAKI